MKKDEKDNEPIDVTKYTLVGIVPKFLTVFPDLEFSPNPTEESFVTTKQNDIPGSEDFDVNSSWFFFLLFSQDLLRVSRVLVPALLAVGGGVLDFDHF
jgi:hypothetical protein